MKTADQLAKQRHDRGVDMNLLPIHDFNLELECGSCKRRLILEGEHYVQQLPKRITCPYCDARSMVTYPDNLGSGNEQK